MTIIEIIEQFLFQSLPLLAILWFGRKTTRDMRFLEQQLQQLTEATANVAARIADPRDAQALAANVSELAASVHKPDCACEDCCHAVSAEPPQPLPTATARFRK